LGWLRDRHIEEAGLLDASDGEALHCVGHASLLCVRICGDEKDCMWGGQQICEEMDCCDTAILDSIMH
jgi:hypothetical protein